MASRNIQIAGAAIFLIDRDVLWFFKYFFFSKNEIGKKGPDWLNHWQYSYMVCVFDNHDTF